tara:strand:- start:2692 stop:8022 length:5331 start_codon:yes stop_codon:yes gene_type:complete
VVFPFENAHNRRLEHRGRFINLIKKLSSLFIFLFLVSCVETNTNQTSNSFQTTENSVSETPQDTFEANTPNTGSLVNFFQINSEKFKTNFPISEKEQRVFYLRGQKVSNYLKTVDRQNPACVSAVFTEESLTKVLILAGSPQSFFNFTDGTLEYYYSFEPSNTSKNKSNCQTSSIINQRLMNYPSHQIVFDLLSICDNCGVDEARSKMLYLESTNGANISSIEITNLSITIQADPGGEIFAGSSCELNSECTVRGFDCCSGGICVKDKAPKPGVAEIDSQTGEILRYLIPEGDQIQSDINTNPQNIFNYPDFFYFCQEETGKETEVIEPELTNEEKAFMRLNEMIDLYRCITPIEGEMSICTNRIASPTTREIVLKSIEDDQTFLDTYSGTNADEMEKNAIREIIHISESLFLNDEIQKEGTIQFYNEGTGETKNIDNASNDNLETSTFFRLNNPIDEQEIPADTIAIRYQVNGTCNRLNDFLAECKKYYVQGQNLGQTDDHYPASNKFKLPYYADGSRLIKVSVNDNLKMQGTEYEKKEDDGLYIEFIGTTNQVFDTQRVEISYFVNITNFPQVGQSKLNALNRIDQLCNCGGPYCGLEPIASPNNPTEVVDFRCIYPEPENNFPFDQRVVVSAKNAPERFFDENGLNQESITIDTPEQEKSNEDGVAFRYNEKDKLKPNNVSQYIGFQEIYGRQDIGSLDARPPTTLTIEKGKTYDIFVDQGTFSTCSNCGNDYYSTILKMFPDNFSARGAGYRSTGQETDPFSGNKFPMHDLVFGRACFVPATMIPWTHKSFSNPTVQRKNRKMAQHFLFANGYKRDWYGFNYGSLIGSFDGVSWFAVGNQRRIQAKSNKLYLAINSFYSDLNQSNAFVVHVVEGSLIVGSGSQVTTDAESDGATCRKFHQCEYDSDCAAQLGWDYVCESVDNFQSEWPMFARDGSELPGTGTNRISFNKILSSTETGKRCVYRGAGAPCHTASTTNTYLSSNSNGVIMCAPNFYCQTLETEDAFFNNRISRYAKSPAYQNESDDVPEDELDLIGFGARLLGRPFSYNGKETLIDDNNNMLSNFSANNLQGICLPGKNVKNLVQTFIGKNSLPPEAISTGDKITGQGMTQDGSTRTSNYLSMCPIFDNDADGGFGDYFYKTTESIDINQTTTDFYKKTVEQVTSTNMIGIFEGANFIDESESLLKDFDNRHVEEFVHDKNKCLRLPGAVCHSNLDCASNEKITNITKIIDIENDETLNGVGNLNRYEVEFWQNTLICSQLYPKGHEKYELKNNRCCRDNSLSYSIPTISLNNQTHLTPVDSNNFSAKKPYITTTAAYTLPQGTTGSDNIDREPRLTGLNIIAHNSKADVDTDTHRMVMRSPTDGDCGFPADPDDCSDISKYNNEFKKIQEYGKKMCCSKHFVRNWHQSNGGGHGYDPKKLNDFNLENFQCMNWNSTTGRQVLVDADGDGVAETLQTFDPVDMEPYEEFTCKGFGGGQSECAIFRVTAPEKAIIVQEELAKYDMLGIPQIGIITDTDNAAIACISDPTTQGDPDGAIIPNLLENLATDTLGFEFSTSILSADHAGEDESGFEFGGTASTEAMKKVWDKDKFSCCLPTNSIIGNTESPSLCCSGYAEDIKISQDETERTCKLPDSTDITLLANRYISSLGDELGIDESDYDPETGFPTIDMDELIELACNADLCGSRIVVTGVAWGRHNVFGLENDQNADPINRFLQSSEDTGVASLFTDNGLKWTNHLYCLPITRGEEDDRGNAVNSILIALGNAGVNVTACGN